MSVLQYHRAQKLLAAERRVQRAVTERAEECFQDNRVATQLPYDTPPSDSPLSSQSDDDSDYSPTPESGPLSEPSSDFIPCMVPLPPPASRPAPPPMPGAWDDFPPEARARWAARHEEYKEAKRALQAVDAKVQDLVEERAAACKAVQAANGKIQEFVVEIKAHQQAEFDRAKAAGTPWPTAGIECSFGWFHGGAPCNCDPRRNNPRACKCDPASTRMCTARKLANYWRDEQTDFEKRTRWVLANPAAERQRRLDFAAEFERRQRDVDDDAPSPTPDSLALYDRLAGPMPPAPWQ